MAIITATFRRWWHELDEQDQSMCWTVFVLYAVIAVCLLFGCQADRRTPSVRPGEASAPQLADLGGRIESGAGEISKDAADIKAQTQDPGFVPAIGLPAIGAKADEITAGAADVQALGAKVRELSLAVKAGEKAAAKLIAENEKLRADRNSLLSKILAGIAVACLVGAVAAIFILHSPKWAAFCGVMFAVAISAQWLLSWAMWIALGVGVVLVVSCVWLFFVQRKSVTEVVKTLEQVKPTLSDTQREQIKQTARRVQSWGTRNIVDKIRGAAKPKKGPA